MCGFAIHLRYGGVYLFLFFSDLGFSFFNHPHCLFIYFYSKSQTTSKAVYLWEMSLLPLFISHHHCLLSIAGQFRWVPIYLPCVQICTNGQLHICAHSNVSPAPLLSHTEGSMLHIPECTLSLRGLGRVSLCRTSWPHTCDPPAPAYWDCRHVVLALYLGFFSFYLVTCLRNYSILIWVFSLSLYLSLSVFFSISAFA